MPLWGKNDNAANSVITAVGGFNKAVTSANQSSLYKNVTAGDFVANVAIGQFAVDTNEIAANPRIPHAGWVIRKEGTGLRAGRVTYETLVAAGSIPNDGTDDTWIPDYTLRITTQPVSSTSNTMGLINFTVAGASTPSGATLGYQWQKQTGPSSWANLSNAAGQYVNVTSATFSANNLTANGNVFRAIVSTTGANSVTSSSATIKYVV